MNKISKILLFLGGIFFLLLMNPALGIESTHTERKIVVFNSGVKDESLKERIISARGGVKTKDLETINAKAVAVPNKAAAEALKKDPRVKRVDDDIRVNSTVQNTPWGIKQIEADKTWATTTGDPIKMAIIDTGIDNFHTDLRANVKSGKNTINPYSSYRDDNGHGTHVAGIAAAINNRVGVVGVGPNIDLYSIKVLNRYGSGYLSDVIEGLEWAIANNMNVVNMSLGTTSDVQSFREAVQRTNQAGIIQVAAAGNNGGAVIYPAAYPEVIAVSASNKLNSITNWSSRGEAVDLIAPGDGIYSTYRGSIYRTMSGTSMASPHVAGAAALVLTTPIGSNDLNGDGIWNPNEVQKKLEDTATDLGEAGKDNLYGSGLVNAIQAIQ